VDVDRREQMQPTQTTIGLDVGLNHFYTDSNGEVVDNPKFLRKSERQLKKLSQRTHQCSHCGTVLDRDHNAALNILAIGLNRVGPPQISTPVESSTSVS
jgi:transposase